MLPAPTQDRFQPPKGYKLKKKRRWPWVLLGLLVVVGVVGAIGSVTSPDDEADDAAEPNSLPIEAAILGVGGTDDTADLDVTLASVQNPFVSTNQFERPADGRKFVAVELDVVNKSDETETFSTLMLLEIVDSLGQHWNVAFAGVDLPQLDGEIPAGSNRRGWAVFEVPNESTGLQLHVKGSLTAKGVTFTL